MLRNVLSRAVRPLAGINRGISSHLNPSTTTSVLLSKLSNATVENDLKAALTSVDCRRIELEPGCSLHFVSESEANVAAKFLKSTLKAETMISRATMPCLMLQNIPEVLSAESLSKSFASHSPQTIHVNDSKSLQMTVSGCDDAIKAVGALSKLSFDGRQLKTTTTKVVSGKYMINMFNLPPNSDLKSVRQTITGTLSALNLQGVSSVRLAKQLAKKTITLRFSPTNTVSAADLEAALNKNATGPYTVSEVAKLQRPALFLRNIAHVEDDLETLLEDYMPNIENIQLVRPQPARSADLAVVYFRSEEAAFACLRKLHSSVVDGERISVTYRETAEKAVRVENLPVGVTEEQLQECCAHLPVQRVEMQKDNCALLVCASPRDAKSVYHQLHGKTLGGDQFQDTAINASVVDCVDFGLVVTASYSSRAELSTEVVSAALKEFEAQPKSMAVQTNVTASIGFMSATEAQRALDRFVRGDIKLNNSAAASTAPESAAGSMVASSLGTVPAYVLQVLGLPESVPVSKLTDALATNVPDVAVIKADRSALVKFRRNRDVVPGMKALKQLEVHGEKFKVERYRPLQIEGDTEYDVIKDATQKKQAKVSKFALSAVLQDFMHLDPATRYQIAKNEFQRELFDARTTQEGLEMLFPEGENLSAEAWEEVQELFHGEGVAEDMTEEEVDNRLFQIYLQLEEMDRYTKGFRHLQDLLGPASSGPFNWSTFDLDNDRDMERVLEELRLCDEEAAGNFAVSDSSDDSSSDSDSDSDAENSDSSSSDSENDIEAADGEDSENELSADSDSDSNSEEDDEEEEEMTEAQELAERRARRKQAMEADEEAEQPECDDDGNPIAKPNRMFTDDQGNRLNLIENKRGDLVDSDGTVWSMVVLNTDTVQKTMPGNRVVSHRALVMLGNMKGAGGFAMGKGKTPDAALTAACRNALRHLVHIDLYDNFGLAHNLFGRHNSCFCYITATPSYREMVASPFASEVLNRFGISSASVKLVGNRNPYSQINAIFNALSKHENIDEIAKDRGKRYLSVRWAHDRNL